MPHVLSKHSSSLKYKKNAHKDEQEKSLENDDLVIRVK